MKKIVIEYNPITGATYAMVELYRTAMRHPKLKQMAKAMRKFQNANRPHVAAAMQQHNTKHK